MHLVQSVLTNGSAECYLHIVMIFKCFTSVCIIWGDIKTSPQIISHVDSAQGEDLGQDQGGASSRPTVCKAAECSFDL